MLEVKGIRKYLGNREILRDVSFSLADNGITALLGPNGAGKTTLMRLLIGYYEPDLGDITINGYSLEANRIKAVSNIAYVPESGGVYPEMTVFEYLKFMADIKHIPQADFAANLDDLASSLELNQVMEQKCETLSKGFSRRVAIAGALISAPKFLILDEPCEGLDVKQKVNLRAFLKKRSRSCAILISTHIMEDVEAMADRILLLSSGQLICDAKPQELKSKANKLSIEASFFSLVQG
ncbi:MAG: ABC transporter ATP-binding protein [Alphaproteobacteria bacterium]|nr:ABC transporter ATP-binding protein [Alphaproteobacteria bacterium]